MYLIVYIETIALWKKAGNLTPDTKFGFYILPLRGLIVLQRSTPYWGFSWTKILLDDFVAVRYNGVLNSL
jgi:hypothetical protein